MVLKMKFYYLEPEVAGELGEKSILDTSQHPPIVKKLHYIFSGWLGDDFLETFPCYIVTTQLSNEIKKENLTGVLFDTLEISKSIQFEEIYPDRKLPEFVWLKPIGKCCVDDFSIGNDNKIVVSERALNIIKKYSINNCEIEIYNS